MGEIVCYSPPGIPLPPARTLSAECMSSRECSQWRESLEADPLLVEELVQVLDKTKDDNKR
jgi:hypothetical protein